jgi:hypothetical protein
MYELFPTGLILCQFFGISMFKSAPLAILLISTGINAHALDISNLFDRLASTPKDSSMTIDAVLERLSEQQNKNLPKMVGEDIRFDKVAVSSGKHLSRHYTMLNNQSPEENKKEFNKNISPALKNQICEDKNLQVFFKHGVSVSYKYRDKEGADVGNVEVTPSDCSQEI